MNRFIMKSKILSSLVVNLVLLGAISCEAGDLFDLRNRFLDGSVRPGTLRTVAATIDSFDQAVVVSPAGALKTGQAVDVAAAAVK